MVARLRPTSDRRSALTFGSIAVGQLPEAECPGPDLGFRRPDRGGGSLSYSVVSSRLRDLVYAGERSLAPSPGGRRKGCRSAPPGAAPRCRAPMVRASRVVDVDVEERRKRSRASAVITITTESPIWTSAGRSRCSSPMAPNTTRKNSTWACGSVTNVARSHRAEASGRTIRHRPTVPPPIRLGSEPAPAVSPTLGPCQRCPSGAPGARWLLTFGRVVRCELVAGGSSSGQVGSLAVRRVLSVHLRRASGPPAWRQSTMKVPVMLLWMLQWYE